jgi:flavodoxin I
MTKIGLFFATQTGNTESVAEMIQKALGNNIVDLNDVGKSQKEDFDRYTCVIIGCPTWNIGELAADWEGFYDELDEVDFSGKKVAYFGLGDQVGYADNFMDAIGILEAKITERGGQTVGYWEIDGYDFNESKALRGGKFAGLAIDEDNQSELTKQRIQQWVLSLKPEFGI